MRKLTCGAVWGGNTDRDEDLCTAGVTASLFARSQSGNKGGDLYYFSA